MYNQRFIEQSFTITKSDKALGGSFIFKYSFNLKMLPCLNFEIQINGAELAVYE